MATNTNDMSSGRDVRVAEMKDSFMKFATSAYSSSKVAWSRARQFTEERIGNAEKTEFDAQFENLCSRADRMKQWTEKMLKQTESMLQPNPGFRMEEFVYEKLDKKTPMRPTNAFILGQTMTDAGRDVGPGTAYGGALAKSGTTLKKIGNAEKDFMQKTMSHYLHPMKRFLENDIKTITKERRALSAKRLDLDAAKSKVKKAQTPERLKQAEIDCRVAQCEFDRQFEITKLLLDGISTSQGNHLRGLHSFVEALGMYYSQCQQYVSELQRELQSPLDVSQSIPPPRPTAPPPYSTTTPSLEGATRPSITRKARVLYDYDATDKSELSLLADEYITVYSVEGMDSDWMMGERGAQKGKVPVTYIELV